MMAVLEVRNGYKFYGREKDVNKKVVLNHLNMTVMNSSIYGLLGSSGCGKTTLLSCIVGQKHLKEGSITILGVNVKKNFDFVRSRIGYMPQEIALVEIMTIKEIIFYFGRIYGVNDEIIKERLTILVDLFELHSIDRQIITLSGGQQRRVSFACVLVHQPDLLILDEPTVGLDPILRSKIWEFLLEATSTSNLAVIITTHYIEEARHASMIGLMRNGKLLAEDTPQNVMAIANSSTLEEAFLILSQKQERSSRMPVNVSVKKRSGAGNFIKQPNALFRHKKPSGLLAKCSFTSKNRMKALLTKNILLVLRQKIGLMFVFIFPLFQISCYYLAIGNIPSNIKVGVVNGERVNYDDCYNESIGKTHFHGKSCSLHKVSYRFLNKLTTDAVNVKQVYFNTTDEAHNEIRRGKIFGFIQFHSNFTESFAEVLNKGQLANNGSFINREIDVYMDITDLQTAYFLQRKLTKLFIDFAQDLMIGCNVSKKVATIPVRFEKPVFGNVEQSFRDFGAPGIIMTMVFFLALLCTASLLISDKQEGVWHRTFIAGISVNEILIAHITVHSVMVTIQCVEIIIYVGLIFEVDIKGDIGLLIMFLVPCGFVGMLFGLIISSICDSFIVGTLLGCAVFYPMIMLCGILWPIEGIPFWFRTLALLLPFSIPIESVRNVIDKGWSISHPQVYNGFLVFWAWIIGVFIICNVILRRQK